jgi:hypothetical protein
MAGLRPREWTVIEPTDEMRDTLWRLLPSEVQEGREPDDIVPWVTAVLTLVERDLSAGWLIWSNEHQMWWKANRAGYTVDVMCAGRYALEDALAETRTRKTATGLPGEVVVRAPHVTLIGDRDLTAKIGAAVECATRVAMAT